MTATNHALTGVVIAIAVKRPELAIPIAFLSHFATDAIPHFHASQASRKVAKTLLYLDLTVGPILILFLTFRLKSSVSWWTIFLCAGSAALPDAVWGYRLFKYRDIKKVTSEPMSAFSRLHENIQWGSNKSGTVIESSWFIGMLLLIHGLAT